MNERRPIMSDVVFPKKQKQPLPEVVRSEQKIFQEPLRPPHDATHLKREYYQVPDQRNSDGRRSSRGVLIGIVVLCTGLLILSLGGLFSGASIVIIPKAYTQNVDVSATFSKSGRQGPKFMTATELVIETEIIPGTQKNTTSQHATGTVRIYNPTATAITIPSQTKIVSSRGHEYVTQQSVVIPKKGLKNPGQKEVSIKSAVAGPEANDSSPVVSFGDKKFQGYVLEMVTPFTGGTQSNDWVVDQSLVQEATTRLLEKTFDSSEVAGRLVHEIPNHLLVLPNSTVVTNPVITVETNHPKGIHVIMTRKVLVVMVDKKELARLMAQKIKDTENKLLAVEDVSGTSITMGALITQQGIAETLPIRIVGNVTITGVVDQEKIRTQVVGKKISEAKDLLDIYQEIDSYRITMTPPWRRIFPESPEKLTITQKKL